MLHRDHSFVRPVIAVVLALAGLVLIGVCGCVTDPPSTPEPEEVLNTSLSAKLSAGEMTDSVAPGAQTVYEIEVGAAEAFEVIAKSYQGTVTTVALVEAPDGTIYTAESFGENVTASRPFAVQSVPLDGGGSGVRVAGKMGQAGTWKISVVSFPLEQFLQFQRTLRTRSFVEKLFLWMYLLNGPVEHPDGLDLIAGLTHFWLPQVGQLERELEVAFSVNIEPADQIDTDDPPTSLPPVPPPPDTTDDGSDDSSNSNANDNGAGDSNGNDNTAGGNTNTNDNANDNSAGNDNAANDNSGNDNAGDNTNDNTGGGNENDNTGGNGNDNGDDIPTPPPSSVVLEEIVRSGDPVPGQSGGATFRYFGNPVIDGDGRVAFWASYTGGAGDGGLYVYADGVLQRILDDDPSTAGSVPGKTSSDYFGNYNIKWDEGTLPLTWGQEGRLIFVANTFGTKNSRGIYRWRASDGDMIRVTDMEQIVSLFPDTSLNVFFCDFRQPVISDANIVSFGMRYSYYSTDRETVLGKHGVFASNGNQVWILADARESLRNPGNVPDQGSSAYFFDVSDLCAGNLDGDVLFQGTYILGSGNHGTYMARNGYAYRVVDDAPGRTFPGLPAGAIVQPTGDFSTGVSIGAGGRIAIDTTITENSIQRDAVILWDGSAWHELRGPNAEPATDLLSGVNNDGQVVVRINDRPYLGDGMGLRDLMQDAANDLVGQNPQWEAVAGALNDQGRALLRYTTADAKPGIALWTGEALILAADTGASSALTSFGELFAMSKAETDRPDRCSALNNFEEMVFRVAARGADGQINTTDDVQAIFFGRGQ